MGKEERSLPCMWLLFGERSHNTCVPVVGLKIVRENGDDLWAIESLPPLSSLQHSFTHSLGDSMDSFLAKLVLTGFFFGGGVIVVEREEEVVWQCIKSFENFVGAAGIQFIAPGYVKVPVSMCS